MVASRPKSTKEVSHNILPIFPHPLHCPLLSLSIGSLSLSQRWARLEIFLVLPTSPSCVPQVVVVQDDAVAQACARCFKPSCHRFPHMLSIDGCGMTCRIASYPVVVLLASYPRMCETKLAGSASARPLMWTDDLFGHSTFRQSRIHTYPAKTTPPSSLLLLSKYSPADWWLA